MSQEAVVSWVRQEEGEDRLRAPVLPDLRAGAGLTIVLWLDMDDINLLTAATLMDGMSRVSGSLGDVLIETQHSLNFISDEEDAEDIVKGFRIEVNQKLRLVVSDGFGLEFDFELENFDKDYMKRL